MWNKRMDKVNEDQRSPKEEEEAYDDDVLKIRNQRPTEYILSSYTYSDSDFKLNSLPCFS